jgi:hypothetical protein
MRRRRKEITSLFIRLKHFHRVMEWDGERKNFSSREIKVIIRRKVESECINFRLSLAFRLEITGGFCVPFSFTGNFYESWGG